MTTELPQLSHQDLIRLLTTPELKVVTRCADLIGRPCYAVGGFVRDVFLSGHKVSGSDIDCVCVGNGIEVARLVASAFGKKASLAIFKTYGTAQVKYKGKELEFVGARRESYSSDSRNPVVSEGTLDDDISRRDFTVNAMALSLNSANLAELVDPYNGMEDLRNGIIRTPLDPDITFSDDPLRMLRAIRFATRLNFDIYPETLEAISRNAHRITIITRERIATELMKIMATATPSRGWMLLEQTGLLAIILPQLADMRGVETVNGKGHKDNFLHTLEVLDNVAAKSDNVWLRWAALLHDIAKPVTKRWDDKLGWTFHNHNFIGAKMVGRIFKALRLPLDSKLKYVEKLVELHMRPIALVEDDVTDSAVRRLIHDAGDDLDDLMLLCSADITSKNPAKVKRLLQNFEHVKQKMVELEERDHIRNYQPPVDGIEIMKAFGIAQGKEVGLIKSAIKEAILEGKVANEHDAAYEFMIVIGASLGLKPVE